MAIPVVFDVLGTLFGFDGMVQALQKRFPELTEREAKSLCSDAFHSGQRNFTYLSMNGDYQPIAACIKATLPTILLEAGVLASPTESFGLDSVTATLTSLNPRPSFQACHRLLAADSNFRLMGATNGAAESTRSLFDQSLGEEESRKWAVWSCNEIQVAKPAPAVYEAVWRKLGLESKEERNGWFVASHSWDLHAAKRAGFKTAWVAHEEHIPLEEIFGTPDIIAVDLEDAAKQIIARETE